MWYPRVFKAATLILPPPWHCLPSWPGRTAGTSRGRRTSRGWDLSWRTDWRGCDCRRGRPWPCSRPLLAVWPAPWTSAEHSRSRRYPRCPVHPSGRSQRTGAPPRTAAGPVGTARSWSRDCDLRTDSKLLLSTCFSQEIVQNHIDTSYFNFES